MTVEDKAKNAAAPEGWLYEGADPSVGISGGEWHHEDCTVLQGPGNPEALGVEEVVTQLTDPDEHGMALIGYVLTCNDCYSVALFAFGQYVGLEESEAA